MNPKPDFLLINLPIINIMLNRKYKIKEPGKTGLLYQNIH